MNQGDRNGGRNNNFRGRDNGGRLDREIDKFNKDSAPLAEEMRGKETRERERDNKNRNGKQRGDYDVLGSRKQERFCKLREEWRQEETTAAATAKTGRRYHQDTGPSGETYHQRAC